METGVYDSWPQSWAGEILRDQLEMESMRAVVRAHLSAEEGTSRNRVRKEMGISLKRLDLFLAGADIGARGYAALCDWCAGRPTPPVAPEAVAVGVLVRYVPVERVGAARMAIGRSVAQVLLDARAAPPPDVLEALDPR